MSGLSNAFIDLTIEDDEVNATDNKLEQDAELARRLQAEFDNEGLEEDADDDDEGNGEIIDIDAGTATVLVGPSTEPLPPRIELERIELDCGFVETGDVVEVNGDPETPLLRKRRTGDFFLIKKILEDMESGQMTICGYRLKRCTRLQPLFDGKLNDLALTMDVERYNPQPHHVQGEEEIAKDQIFGKRNCIFTDRAYSEMGLRSSLVFVPNEVQQRGTKAISDYVFNNGPLYCRWVYVSIKEPGTKPYGGEVRRIYRREVVEFGQWKIRPHARPAGGAGGGGDDDDNGDDCVIVPSPRQAKRVRSSSLEELDHDPRKRRPGVTEKATKLTFADFFCGAGGASFGAVNAGYELQFGVEIDSDIVKSFHLNHPDATAINMDAHDFAAWANRQNFSVDHIHFSTTCKYFSVSHTVDGKNDQENFETIFVVGAVLKVLKPSYATAEQADGMIKLAKHRLTFRKFLSTILEAGYNVRYQVTDLVQFGLPQRRRRLLFNMAKIGYPLPPFPNPICGPPGSGLNRYVSVADVWRDLEQMPGPNNDPLHQPQSLPRINMPPYDPHRSLLPGCITTNGGNNYHHSGTRKCTARELSECQTFPPHAQFVGSPTAAIVMIGNGYPPKPASLHFLACAQTREAFENGLFDAEEDVRDLWVTLNARGVNIAHNDARYLYLNRLERNRARPGYIPPSIYARIGQI